MGSVFRTAFFLGFHSQSPVVGTAHLRTLHLILWLQNNDNNNRVPPNMLLVRGSHSIPHCCAYWQRQCGVLLLNRRTPTAGPTIGSVSAVLYAVSRCLAFIPIVSEVPSNQELSALGLAAAHPGSPDKRC